LEFNLNKKHFYDKNIICHSWGGRVPTIFEKWASAKPPKVGRFQFFFIIFEFKFLNEQGHFCVKHFLGPRLP
jgi:hypothetical protein